MKRIQATQSIQNLQGELTSGRLVLEPDESVLASFQGDEAVLLDYMHGEYYGLNAVAASVWKRLRAGRPFCEVVDDVASLYDVSTSTASFDVTRLVADLLALGVLHLNEIEG